MLFRLVHTYCLGALAVTVSSGTVCALMCTHDKSVPVTTAVVGGFFSGVFISVYSGLSIMWPLYVPILLYDSFASKR